MVSNKPIIKLWGAGIGESTGSDAFMVEGSAVSVRAFTCEHCGRDITTDHMYWVVDDPSGWRRYHVDCVIQRS